MTPEQEKEIRHGMEHEYTTNAHYMRTLLTALDEARKEHAADKLRLILDNTSWESSYDRVVEERDAARAALAKYGHHINLCCCSAGVPCTCGFITALEGAK